MKRLSVILMSAMFSANALAQPDGGFALIESGSPAKLCYSAGEDAGIVRAVRSFAADVQAVCGQRPAIDSTSAPAAKAVCIGRIGSPIINQLSADGRIDTKKLEGKREMFIIKSTPEQIIVAGSDKRGTIYGIYELSRRMGVSAWAWWADVPVPQQKDVNIAAGEFTDGEPAVVYRGIFLNDEWPSLGAWAVEKFGGFNSKFYEKVFELLLRLRGNFMWPAMWASAFYDDDPRNGALANEMGIVMGTSHHEPMAQSQQDWKRRGSGAWDYSKNAKTLDNFWRDGIRRCRDWETVVTVGMRGDGDEPMDDKTNIALLSNVVKNQRKIIADEMKKAGKKTMPQVWALYKEVQDYYDMGMTVPDDVTLLLCDDNWGNIRRLPDPKVRNRKGGFGMYYHFDYVGGPRNYKWLNVSQAQRIWEQMDMCYRHGVRQIWIVNVGDLKPMEYPIQLFMDMAWNPDKFNAYNIFDHTVEFCRTQFGEQFAHEAARLIDTYTKYNSRRTPEMLAADTYSLDNYDEWRKVVEDYKFLELDALRLAYLMPEKYRAAFDQLVMYPILACANLYEMYYAQAQNRRLAAKHDTEANVWADMVKRCYVRDSLLAKHYHSIADGKWNHMMDQTHIGYAYWQQPDANAMPAVGMVPQNRMAPPPPVFACADGHVAIEAENFSKRSGEWTVIPNMGRTHSAVKAVNATPDTWLEYSFDMPAVAEATAYIYMSPTLDIFGKGLRIAVSVDGGEEQTIDIHGKYDIKTLEKWQGERINIVEAKLGFVGSGTHSLRVRPLDGEICFQRIVIDAGGLQPSYLGAPQSAQKRQP